MATLHDATVEGGRGPEQVKEKRTSSRKKKERKKERKKVSGLSRVAESTMIKEKKNPLTNQHHLSPAHQKWRGLL